MEAVKLRSGLQTVMHISARGNLYLQSSGLNKVLKAENPKRCAQVVVRTINLIYILSALVYPFMSSTSESVLTQLNAPARAVPEVLSIDILPGHQIGILERLFKKIDERMIKVHKESLQAISLLTEKTRLLPTLPPVTWKKEAKGKVSRFTGDTGSKAADELKRLKAQLASYQRKVKAEVGAVATTN